MRRLLIASVIGLFLFTTDVCAQNEGRWTMAFWNVENFFDTQHDSIKEDIAFTSHGENHWTTKRYSDKRSKIYKMVAAMQWPVVVGLAEVENDRVLQDLCLFTPLRKQGYEFVHYESPDKRGIDCALLYRKDQFKVVESRPIVVSDSSEDFFTRDILMVGGILGNGDDTCYLFVNHWPSKRNGAVAERHRMEIAQLLMGMMDSIRQAHPAALVLAMGDFNAAPEEEAISKGMGFEGRCRNATGFYNLMCKIPPGEGSYKYKDNWSCIDQMIANRELEAEVFVAAFMMTDDTRYMGMKPFRTYSGMQYLGGYSDHLPIIVRIP